MRVVSTIPSPLAGEGQGGGEHVVPTELMGPRPHSDTPCGSYDGEALRLHVDHTGLVPLGSSDPPSGDQADLTLGPDHANGGQSDGDGDGIGDVCDT